MELDILEDLINFQRNKMLEYSRNIYPFMTPDDLLQPNDFPKLENCTYFRFEEGILTGLLQAKAALLASNPL
jgi:MoxR-like ATPase